MTKMTHHRSTIAAAAMKNAAYPSLYNGVTASTENSCMLRSIPEEVLKIIVLFGDVASNTRFAATFAPPFDAMCTRIVLRLGKILTLERYLH